MHLKILCLIFIYKCFENGQYRYLNDFIYYLYNFILKSETLQVNQPDGFAFQFHNETPSNIFFAINLTRDDANTGLALFL